MRLKDHSIRKQTDFKKIAYQGSYFTGKLLSLKKLGNNLSLSRWAIVVSAKVSKKATERNKLKRRLKEIMRLRLKELPKGQDLLIITRPAAKGKSYKVLTQELNFLLKKAKLC